MGDSLLNCFLEGVGWDCLGLLFITFLVVSTSIVVCDIAPYRGYLLCRTIWSWRLEKF